MKKAKWIHQNNVPLKLPVTSSVVLYLLLDKLQVAGWVQGVAWTVMSLIWLTGIVAIVNSERLEEFK